MAISIGKLVVNFKSSQGRRAFKKADRPGGDPTSFVDATLARGGAALADRVLNRMERALGHDFGSVRIHADAHADQAARSIDAHAFTTGKHIFFAQSKFRPETAEGQALLAHELTHVVQQKGGAGGGTRAEREAETVEAAVRSGKPAPKIVGGQYTPGPVIQRKARNGGRPVEANPRWSGARTDEERTRAYPQSGERVSISGGQKARLATLTDAAPEMPPAQITERYDVVGFTEVAYGVVTRSWGEEAGPDGCYTSTTAVHNSSSESYELIRVWALRKRGPAFFAPAFSVFMGVVAGSIGIKALAAAAAEAGIDAHRPAGPGQHKLTKAQAAELDASIPVVAGPAPDKKIQASAKIDPTSWAGQAAGGRMGDRIAEILNGPVQRKSIFSHLIRPSRPAPVRPTRPAVQPAQVQVKPAVPAKPAVQPPGKAAIQPAQVKPALPAKPAVQPPAKPAVQPAQVKPAAPAKPAVDAAQVKPAAPAKPAVDAAQIKPAAPAKPAVDAAQIKPAAPAKPAVDAAQVKPAAPAKPAVDAAQIKPAVEPSKPAVDAAQVKPAAPAKPAVDAAQVKPAAPSKPAVDAAQVKPAAPAKPAVDAAQIKPAVEPSKPPVDAAQVSGKAAVAPELVLIKPPPPPLPPPPPPPPPPLKVAPAQVKVEPLPAPPPLPPPPPPPAQVKRPEPPRLFQRVPAQAKAPAPPPPPPPPGPAKYTPPVARPRVKRLARPRYVRPIEKGPNAGKARRPARVPAPVFVAPAPGKGGPPVRQPPHLPGKGGVAAGFTAIMVYPIPFRKPGVRARNNRPILGREVERSAAERGRKFNVISDIFNEVLTERISRAMASDDVPEAAPLPDFAIEQHPTTPGSAGGGTGGAGQTGGSAGGNVPPKAGGGALGGILGMLKSGIGFASKLFGGTGFGTFAADSLKAFTAGEGLADAIGQAMGAFKSQGIKGFGSQLGKVGSAAESFGNAFKGLSLSPRSPGLQVGPQHLEGPAEANERMAEERVLAGESRGGGSSLVPAEGGGERLAGPARDFVENFFGRSFSDVRIHRDGTAVAASDALQAHAFTAGRDVYFGRGEFRPDSAMGMALLVHELTHVVQQGPGVKRKAIAGLGAEAMTDKKFQMVEAMFGGGESRVAVAAPEKDQAKEVAALQAQVDRARIGAGGSAALKAAIASISRFPVLAEQRVAARATALPGMPIPADFRARFEEEIDADLSRVRIFTGSDANRAARGLGADAFAHGQNIVLGEKAAADISSGHAGTLAHELEHVRQHQRGEHLGSRSPLAKEILESTAAEVERRVPTFSRIFGLDELLRSPGMLERVAEGLPGELETLRPPARKKFEPPAPTQRPDEEEPPQDGQNVIHQLMLFYGIRPQVGEEDFLDELTERVSDLMQEELRTERERRHVEAPF